MKRRGGLTLLETLLSLALLSGTALVLLNLFPYSAMVVRRSGDRLQAEQLSQAMLAEFRVQAYTSLKEGTSVLDEVKLNGVPFRRTLDIWSPDGDADKLLACRATVIWKGMHGDEQFTQALYRAHLQQ